MSFAVDLLDEVGYGRLDDVTVTRLCSLALAERNLSPEKQGELSVVLVSTDEIHRLNREFRSVDRPTDVLSFEMDGPGGEVLGEIVICPERAEMGLDELVVHGMLHLCGMDHGDDFEDSDMHVAQERVLDEFGRRYAG